MKQQKHCILISNDDGIHASGLALLHELAMSLSDDIWIVAPENERSGTSHALTLSRPLRVRKLDDKRFAVSGTPTDSVIMAMNQLMPKKPTLVLSGVNRGSNLGEHVTYSGTVAVAMEGALAGVRSIALSQSVAGGVIDWSAARQYGGRLLADLIADDWGADTYMNVNFPAVAAEAVKGIQVTKQGYRRAENVDIVTRRDPRGFAYHWFGLTREGDKPEAESDLQASRAGYITVTPLQFDLTQQEMRRQLQARMNCDF